MCSSFLESNSCLNIVLVLCIRVKNITFLLSITVCTSTVCENSLNGWRTIVISLASLACLVTLYCFTATIETFLEISYINHSRDRNIESSEAICAHKQILRRICVYRRTCWQWEIFHAFTASSLTWVKPASTSHIAHIWRIAQLTRLDSKLACLAKLYIAIQVRVAIGRTHTSLSYQETVATIS